MPLCVQVLVGGVACDIDASSITPTQLSCRAPTVAGQLLAEFWQMPAGTRVIPENFGSYTRPGEARGCMRFVRLWPHAHGEPLVSWQPPWQLAGSDHALLLCFLLISSAHLCMGLACLCLKALLRGLLQMRACSCSSWS